MGFLSSSRSSSSNATSDDDVIVAEGGVNISSDGAGRFILDFRDDNAVNAAREATRGAITSAQDLGRLAISLAQTSQGNQQLIRLGIVAGALLGMAFFLSRSRALA